MTAELSILLYSILLQFILIMIPAYLAVRHNGAKAQAGPRDRLPKPSAMVARGRRLAANGQENLVLFGGLVLVAHAAGVSTDGTVLGAQIFLGARIAHAVIYLAGWPWIRPIAWFLGVIGMGMIAYALL